MSNHWPNSAKGAIIRGSTTGSHIVATVDLLNDTIKIAALEDDTGEDIDADSLSEIIANGAVEVTSTGYTGGHGGAGRKTITSPTFSIDKTNDRWEFDFTNPTWSAISRAASETWVAFVIHKEGSANDTTAQAIAHIDTGTNLPLTPNGSDIEFQVPSEGLLHLT